MAARNEKACAHKWNTMCIKQNKQKVSRPEPEPEQQQKHREKQKPTTKEIITKTPRNILGTRVCTMLNEIGSARGIKTWCCEANFWFYCLPTNSYMHNTQTHSYNRSVKMKYIQHGNNDSEKKFSFPWRLSGWQGDIHCCNKFHFVLQMSVCVCVQKYLEWSWWIQ